MFGGSSFVSLGGAGGQVKLAQQAPSYPPAPAAALAPAPAPTPAPMPVSVPPPAVVAPVPVVTTGISHGAQVAIAAGIFGVTILGAIFLSD